MANISVIGSGYVGLVTGACLAEFGMMVTCQDKDSEKINNLKAAILPIYEPGLEDVVAKNIQEGRLSFTTSIEDVIRCGDIIFVAVGTPPLDDGSADLSNVMEVLEDVLSIMNADKVLVMKSTVPVGTAAMVMEYAKCRLRERGSKFNLNVVSNPEFLREGSAVYDFMHPDRVVIGAETELAIETMKEVYRVLYLNSVPFVITDNISSELIKYGSNAYLATKISFINDMSRLCDAVGGNVQTVAKAMGMDNRIGPKFLHPGPGYGGSCLPKDTCALVRSAELKGVTMHVVAAAIQANTEQKSYSAKKIFEAFGGSVKGKKIGVLGVTFKPNTDDMRAAPSVDILRSLVGDGAKINVFDPKGHHEFVLRMHDVMASCKLCSNEYEALEGVDALVIMTEWNQFRKLNLKRVHALMRGNVFVDLRNIYIPSEVRKEGFQYYGIGTR